MTTAKAAATMSPLQLHHLFAPEELVPGNYYLLAKKWEQASRPDGYKYEYFVAWWNNGYFNGLLGKFDDFEVYELPKTLATLWDA